MIYTSFFEYFPAKARTETRGMLIPEQNDFGVPMGKYLFIEYYCADLDCDCRNVSISVFNIETSEVQATISYGWEPIEFYRDWMGSETDGELRDFKGPALKPFSPQSKFARQWLHIYKLILADKDYEKRLRHHYKIVKAKIENKNKNRSKNKR